MLIETKILMEEGPSRKADGVLVCDDNRLILKFMVSMLGELGYKAFKSETPGEAIKIAQAETDSIALHLLDIDLPGMDGRALHRLLKEYSPDAKCILVSGYSKEYIEDSGCIPVGVGFIQKPFGYEAFVDEIREAVDVLSKASANCS